MSIVDSNRLNGNYAASLVTLRLSSECLVRPVAADTDIGVDLYCETVMDEKPFLHFWLQVKSGQKCIVSKDAKSASYSFHQKHLDYWERQPVPVFAALVHQEWPVKKEPMVYIVDITSKLIQGVTYNKSNKVKLQSDYIWHPRDQRDVISFLYNAVPAATARLQCMGGVVAPQQTNIPKYEISIPVVPVTRYSPIILDQIRRTATSSILFLPQLNGLVEEFAFFRKTLSSVVEQFGDDPHYENFYARAISYHTDKEFEKAVEFYNRAIKSIRDDKKISLVNWWKKRLKEIERLCEKAKKHETIS